MDIKKISEDLYETLLIQRNNEINSLFNTIFKFKIIKIDKFYRFKLQKNTSKYIKEVSKNKNSILLLENVGEIYKNLRIIKKEKIRSYANTYIYNKFITNLKLCQNLAVTNKNNQFKFIKEKKILYSDIKNKNFKIFDSFNDKYSPFIEKLNLYKLYLRSIFTDYFMKSDIDNLNFTSDIIWNTFSDYLGFTFIIKTITIQLDSEITFNNYFTFDKGYVFENHNRYPLDSGNNYYNKERYAPSLIVFDWNKNTNMNDIFYDIFNSLQEKKDVIIDNDGNTDLDNMYNLKVNMVFNLCI